MSEIEQKLKSEVNFVNRSEDFDIYFVTYFSDENKRNSDWFNDKIRRVKDDKLSYRLINHWSNFGLIDENRPKGKGWRRFSIIEMIWINIIYELRKFGFPLEKILLVKKSLMQLNDKIPVSPFPYLEVYVHLALRKKMEIFLLVFNNGEAEPINSDEYNFGVDFNFFNNHLKISLTQILQKLFKNADLTPEKKSTVKLSDVELDLLFMVRTEQFETLTIVKRNGKIDRIDKTEYLEVDRKLSSILCEGDYQRIELIQSGGEVTAIRRTLQKKVK